jgi:Mrp family chromosome partitioning ATPase
MARALEQRTSRSAPSLAEYAQAVWRRKPLVAAGLVLGLTLGALVLPRMRTSQATYQATVRLKVVELVSDTIVRERPQFDTSKVARAGGESNALQDVDVARRALRRLGWAAAGLKADDVATRMKATPVTRSSFVDLAYTDSDPVRAGQVVEAYAKAWATQRNTVDARRLKAAMAGVDTQIAELQREVNRLSGAATTDVVRLAELTRVQGRLNALVKLHDEVLRQQLFLGAPTAVAGGPVVSRLSGPTPRGLILVLGLVIGLLSGVGCALLLESARPSVLAPADVERASGAQVIASVPPTRAVAGLPVLRRPFSPAAEGYRRVAGALERRGLGGEVRMVAVVSADPGEGKTLLCANLAHSLARQGHDVVLVSADLRHPRLDALVDLDGEPGLAEWLEDGAAGAAPPLRRVVDHLLVLPAGETSRSPAELFTAGGLRRRLQPLADAGFMVLIDTPPALWSAEAMTLAAVADATLLVTRARVSRFRAVEQVAEGLRRDGVRAIGAVLVGYRRRSAWLALRKPYSVGRVGRHQSGAHHPRPAPAAAAQRPPANDDPTMVQDASLAEVERLRGWLDPSAAPTGAKPDRL